MNTRMGLLSLTLCACVVFVAACLTFTSARAAHADGGGDESLRLVNATAPVSLAEGQTLRVNFLNAGRSPFEIIPCVFDGDGAHLKTGEAMRLAPGQTRSFHLSRAEAGRLGDGSVRVRAGVHLDGSVMKSLVVSAEVVEDATGRSTLFLDPLEPVRTGQADPPDPVHPGENSPPDPIHDGDQNPPDPIRDGEEDPPDPVSPGEVTRSLAPVGITAGQTLRVNFVNVGGSPLEIIPCIFDGDGAHLKTGAPLRLAPGQTISFEMNRAEAGPRDEAHLLVRGAAHVRNADRKNLLVTGEVVEDATGRSSLFMPGARAGFDPQPDPPAAR